MPASETPHSPLYREFGASLREARTDAALTQEQLGQAVGLGRTSITNIERGDQPVALHVLFALARALQKRPCELLPSGQPTAEFEALDPTLLDDEDEQVADWARRVLRTGRN